MKTLLKLTTKSLDTQKSKKKIDENFLQNLLKLSMNPLDTHGSKEKELMKTFYKNSLSSLL